MSSSRTSDIRLQPINDCFPLWTCIPCYIAADIRRDLQERSGVAALSMQDKKIILKAIHKPRDSVTKTNFLNVTIREQNPVFDWWSQFCLRQWSTNFSRKRHHGQLLRNRMSLQAKEKWKLMRAKHLHLSKIARISAWKGGMVVQVNLVDLCWTSCAIKILYTGGATV